MTSALSIAVIPGDGVGIEVTAAAVRVLEAALSGGDVSLKTTEFPWGSAHYHATGVMIPAGGTECLKEFDAILFGACGSPEIPDDVTLWELRLAICQGLDQYVALRPARTYSSVPSPVRTEAFDFVVVRENTEGEYSGAGGLVHHGLPMELAVETAVFTRASTERVVDYAFELARRRRRHVTSITKSNAQRYGMKLWDNVVAERAAHYPDVTVRQLLVDAAAARLVTAPHEFDVIVASNLFGDILSDLGGAMMGSLGLAASGNIDVSGRNPSMFEPVHGSAPDLAGRGIANPIGAIASAALMLNHLGHADIAESVEEAVRATLADGIRTPDVGGEYSTAEVGAAVAGRLTKSLGVATSVRGE